MASRQYLLEQFEKLVTEEERARFCLEIFSQEFLGRSEWQRDMLPEGFGRQALANLEGALADAGRHGLWQQFWRALQRYLQDRQNGVPNAAEIFARAAVGMPLGP